MTAGALVSRPPEEPATLKDELLVVDRLFVRYGKNEAIRGVSLRVRAGEIVTVIGPNGAGKTTLLMALMGALPSKGDIAFEGRVFRTADISQRVGRGVSLVPETRALFPTMSVEDNLRLGAFRFRREPRSCHQQALEEVYALFPRLQERRRQTAATLSGGERQMLTLGRALMTRPRLLLLDEPSLGLAPAIVREIFRIVEGLRSRGVAVLLVEQNARAAMSVADRGYVLELGEVSLEGDAARLREDPRVIDTYLGTRAIPAARLQAGNEAQ